MKFEIGDIVSLIGEKRKMTVTKIHGCNVSCSWFTTLGELQKADFPKGALKKIEEKKIVK